MLRGVFLKNFVGFEKAQSIQFPENESPGIFVGENGSGKSSLLEGIRRCLSWGRSTSTSSSYNEGEHSFFVCKYDTTKCDENDKLKTYKLLFTGILTDNNTYYKFVSTPSELLIDQYELRGRFQLSGTADSISDILEGALKAPGTHTLDPETITGRMPKTDPKTKKGQTIITDPITTIDQTTTTTDPTTITDQMTITDSKHSSSQVDSKKSKVEEILEKLETYVVMTFPLRSIGPLQWSKSEKIAKDKLEANYLEACQRGEIIRYFLETKDQEFLETKDQEFDFKKEESYFRGLSGRPDISFSLSGEGEHIDVTSNETILPGENRAFLKIPEGILEAKHFSILMSSTKFLTVVLEEPDAGMHSQMVERMMSIIRSEKKDKMVVLSTHNPCFVSPTTISRLTVFKRRKPQENGERKNVPTEVISGADIAERKGSGLKALRMLTRGHFADLIFAKKILFCEGCSDFLFLTALKEHIMEPSPGVSHILELLYGSDVETARKKLQNIAVSLQIISMDGWYHAEYVHDLCEELKLDDHHFVCDKDVVIKYNDKTKDDDNKFVSKRCRWLAKNVAEIDELADKYNEKAITWEDVRKTLRNKYKCFVWRDGTIEDMLISLLRGETQEKKIQSSEKEQSSEKAQSSEANGDTNGTLSKKSKYDYEVVWFKKERVIQELKQENVSLPLSRWREKRHKLKDPGKEETIKLFKAPTVSNKNVTKSVEIFLKACDDRTDDLVQFVDFLLNMKCD